MKIKIVYFIVVILAFSTGIISRDIEGIITIDGVEREYILHLPDGYGGENLPLVMVYHGGGGTAKQIKNHVKFDKLADKENFIAVYPNAVNKNWNDGRNDEKLKEKYDDVKFINTLLDTLIKNYKIDTSRIFATGISNGGFFSIYLAYKLSQRILAIAPVTANIPADIATGFKTEYPVSLLLVNGTDDPLVKYDGGAVGYGEDGFGRGESISTDRTIDIWVKNNGCSTAPVIEDIPNKNLRDKCKAEKFTYTACSNNTEVILIKINGGGHTWPGASQYLPKILVGIVCKDFSATEMIWEFFKSRTVR